MILKCYIYLLSLSLLLFLLSLSFCVFTSHIQIILKCHKNCMLVNTLHNSFVMVSVLFLSIFSLSVSQFLSSFSFSASFFFLTLFSCNSETLLVLIFQKWNGIGGERERGREEKMMTSDDNQHEKLNGKFTWITIASSNTTLNDSFFSLSLSFSLD